MQVPNKNVISIYKPNLSHRALYRNNARGKLDLFKYKHLGYTSSCKTKREYVPVLWGGQALTVKVNYYW